LNHGETLISEDLPFFFASRRAEKIGEKL